jgi:hypothetical protein
MRYEPYHLGRDETDFAEVWRNAQFRRADDVSSDIETLKTVGLFCAAGLLVSMIFALCGLDIDVDYF